MTAPTNINDNNNESKINQNIFIKVNHQHTRNTQILQLIKFMSVLIKIELISSNTGKPLRIFIISYWLRDEGARISERMAIMNAEISQTCPRPANSDKVIKFSKQRTHYTEVVCER